MRRTKEFFGGIFLVLIAFCLALMPQRASSRTAGAKQEAANAEPVPAFHAAPPTGQLPATLSPALFTDPLVQNTYRLAAHIKKILYQEPCYCHCDRSEGHGSLFDCYAGRHAAECGTCIREGLYVYEQSRKGKSAAQIRAGIERGDWQEVDLAKYASPSRAK
jgi:Protein of unknown function with PCYCGC motif